MKWSCHLLVLGPFRETAHTEKNLSEVDAEFVHNTQGITGPSDQHEESLQQPQKHPIVPENVATLPKLSPQLQLLQTGCTDTPAQRNTSFITHSWCPLCHLPGSVTPPPHPAAQPWGMLLHRGQTSPFAEPPPPLSQLSLSHTCDTLFLTVTFSHTGTKDTGVTAMLTRSCTCILSPNHWCSNPVKKMLVLMYDSFSLFSFQTSQLLKLSVASEQHQEAMEHSMDIFFISRAMI